MHKIKFAIHFPEWLHEKGLDVEFKEMSKEILAETLRKFYATVRQNNKDGSDTRNPHAKQSLINTRSALNPHIQYPLYNRTWYLMHDAEFRPANKIFSGELTLFN